MSLWDSVFSNWMATFSWLVQLKMLSLDFGSFKKLFKFSKLK
jgi:hypothetical protein